MEADFCMSGVESSYLLFFLTARNVISATIAVHYWRHLSCHGSSCTVVARVSCNGWASQHVQPLCVKTGRSGDSNTPLVILECNYNLLLFTSLHTNICINDIRELESFKSSCISRFRPGYEAKP